MSALLLLHTLLMILVLLKYNSGDVNHLKRSIENVLVLSLHLALGQILAAYCEKVEKWTAKRNKTQECNQDGKMARHMLIVKFGFCFALDSQ